MKHIIKSVDRDSCRKEIIGLEVDMSKPIVIDAPYAGGFVSPAMELTLAGSDCSIYIVGVEIEEAEYL